MVDPAREIDESAAELDGLEVPQQIESGIDSLVSGVAAFMQTDFFDSLQALPDVLSELPPFPITELTDRQISFLSCGQQFTRFKHYMDLLDTIGSGLKRGAQDDDRSEWLSPMVQLTMLALSIPGHDFAGLLGCGSSASTMFEKTPGPKRADGLVRDLWPLEVLCGTMVYLSAGGEPRFLRQVNQKNFNAIVQRLFSNKKYDLNLTAEGDQSALLSTAECAIAYQMLRNQKYIPLGKSEVQIKASDDKLVLTFLDDGPGIRDKDRTALAPEKISTIFASFTSRSKGKGVGLELSAQLANLRGGLLEVISSPRDGEAVRCNSRDLSPQPVDVDFKGCLFTLTVPRAELLFA